MAETPEPLRFRLADPMDAPEPLLDTVRVPWQIVVHHQVGALQVDTFASCIGRQQDFYIRIVPEGFLRIHPLFSAHAAMNRDNGLSATE